jgi:hypothetical protein
MPRVLCRLNESPVIGDQSPASTRGAVSNAHGGLDQCIPPIPEGQILLLQAAMVWKQ